MNSSYIAGLPAACLLDSGVFYCQVMTLSKLCSDMTDMSAGATELAYNKQRNLALRKKHDASRLGI